MHARIQDRRFERRTAVWLSCLAVALTLATPTAETIETDVCSVEVLVDGRPLSEYAARGTTYVEARRGREYGVRLSNRTDRRIAVALAIDGLNSIDAKTTDASSASKWVLGPYGSVTVEGWQTSAGTARRFFFSTEEHSYGEWLGRIENLGVIEAVVFKEKPPRKTFREWLGGRSSAAPKSSVNARPPVEPESSTAEGSDADDLAATGIGREIDHRVRLVRLDLEHDPATRVRIRYEYRPQLVRLGVLPSPEEAEALERREHAQGFKEFSFSPDPFGGGR